MPNPVYERLVQRTELTIDHFLTQFSDRVINGEGSLFLGTGVSRNSGFPSWAELLTPCATDLGISLDSSADLYAIAQYYVNKYSDSELRRIVSNRINLPLHGNSLLDQLLEINFNSIWTTNYDRLIESSLGKKNILYNAVYNDMNLTSISRHDKVNIFKINGDITDPLNMVLTKNDYEKYSQRHPLFLTFLKRELVSNSFLFVGYSFTDAVVLDCLSMINDFLGQAGSNHYALMMIDQSVTPQFEHFIADLDRRFNIKCILVEKDNIPVIISRLIRRIRERKVFISGAFFNISKEEENFADSISLELVSHLLNSGYRISTGVGKKLGTYITGYAHQYLAERSISSPAKYLSMRPFPFHLELDNQKRIAYRTIMEHDCSAAIFLYGQSESTAQRRLEGKSDHYSEGVYQEFQIAKQLGLKIIPIGATGYEAEIIWSEVKDNINEYYYLSKVIDQLKNESSSQRLARIIISILDDISRNQAIN
ncbi:MAG TPA: SIR2 family protein [Clostridia bacterium]|nr:SIR2 family protein [Clostridia bacterium]